jgi:hypothetical protein
MIIIRLPHSLARVRDHMRMLAARRMFAMGHLLKVLLICSLTAMSRRPS